MNIKLCGLTSVVSKLHSVSLLSHGLLACVVALGMGMSVADAATMTIEFQDLDIAYDNVSGDIVDVGNPDPLGLVQFSVDGDVVDSILAGATLSLNIPNVDPILLGINNVVTSDAGGSFNMDFGGGNFLDLDLEEVSIVYLSATSTLNFTFGVSAASLVGQSLPFNLEIGEPLLMSFSTQITPGTLMADGSFVGSFSASGTGEVSGTLVAEPSSIGLLALGGLLATMMASRYKLG